MTTTPHRTPTSHRPGRQAALVGATGALIFVVTALPVPAGLLPGTPDPSTPGFLALTTLNLLTEVMLLVGLAGFARSGAATGALARVGLALAFLGLAGYAVADLLTFADPLAGESVHPVSVPLTGLGMLLTGIATLRTGRWAGWRRLTPLWCGLVPFVVELPGLLAFGDTDALYFFIACTWACWLALNVATATAPAAVSRA